MARTLIWCLFIQVININNISTLYKLPIAHLLMIQIQDVYFYQLDKWCRNSGEQEAYLPQFSEKLANKLEIAISYDQRMIPALNRLIKHYDYFEFSDKREHRSQLKIKLKKIVRLLAEYQFISVKNCHVFITKMDNLYLRDRFATFLKNIEKAQQTPLEVPQIERIWRSIVQKNFEEVWQFLVNRKIMDPIIAKMYEVCQPCIKKYSIQKIKEIKEYYEINNTYLKPTQQKSTIYDIFSPPSSFKLVQQYNSSINTYITERSLFLNEQKLTVAFGHIKDIISILRVGTSFGQTLTYDLYGSIRTGFALVEDSDGDININPTINMQMTRVEKIRYLFQISQALKKNPLKKLNFSSIQPFTTDKIKVPFIKLKFQYNRSSKNVLKHVDLIVSSPNGVENSKVLEMYSKSDYIIKFCNLAKLWAKRKNLINSKMPIDGFSSYGIVLMSIFYLIKTDQAPFVIQTPNGYRLEKNLLQQKDYKSLYQNFKAFLQFYNCDGSFFNDKMTVCLLPKSPVVHDRFLVNMYDFTDKSNPGRMPKCLSDKFFNSVNLTYKMLTNQYDIKQVLKKQQ